MRLVLPGGAVLGEGRSGGDERAVACRPLAGVIEGCRAGGGITHESAGDAKAGASETDQDISKQQGSSSTRITKDRVDIAKRVLEVLAGLVGLIGALLALFGGSRK